MNRTIDRRSLLCAGAGLAAEPVSFGLDVLPSVVRQWNVETGLVLFQRTPIA